jgi:hypothetical protein
MLPARWDENLQAQAAESLGFDPENPTIKTEISWIIGRGTSSYPGVPLGYQELVVEPGPASTSDERPATSDERRGTRDEGRVTRDERRWTFHAVVIIAGATVLITAIGLYIVFRAARRKS